VLEDTVMDRLHHSYRARMDKDGPVKLETPITRDSATDEGVTLWSEGSGPSVYGRPVYGPPTNGPTANGPTANGPTENGPPVRPSARPTENGPTATGPTATGPPVNGPPRVVRPRQSWYSTHGDYSSQRYGQLVSRSGVEGVYTSSTREKKELETQNQNY
jgi:hypothetical protein